ncbi:MAG TPA: alpha/beta fold hydrolase [Mycobacterium sp.]|jgi:surfactin synthase thioesterase subunit|nr:alpha/beta fold hydrolase [Mycobacterium sp.]
MTRVELVCLHHAGGGSASFFPLRRALGADIAMTAVVLPGRESRHREPKHVDARACVRQLSDELGEVLSGPHVLLGHSMGAMLAYLLAQQRISVGLRSPEAVIVAACRAPHLPGALDGLHRLDDRGLVEQLAQYRGVPTELLSEPDWLELLIPTVRADLRICESYRASGASPLPCPLHIFGGHGDPLVPPEMLAAWSTYSVRPQPVRLFAGGHFLFREPDPDLVDAVRSVVDEAATPG